MLLAFMGTPGSSRPSARFFITALLAIFGKRLLGSSFTTADSKPTRIEREPGSAQLSVAAPNVHWFTPGPFCAENCAPIVKSCSQSGDPPERDTKAPKPYAKPGWVVS